MNQVQESQEQRILQVMRKVLTQVVREITPEPGMRHPLSAETIEDVRQCLALISAREREINAEQGGGGLRPRYPDQPRTTSVVQFHKPTNREPGDSDS